MAAVGGGRRRSAFVLPLRSPILFYAHSLTHSLTHSHSLTLTHSLSSPIYFNYHHCAHHCAHHCSTQHLISQSTKHLPPAGPPIVLLAILPTNNMLATYARRLGFATVGATILSWSHNELTKKRKVRRGEGADSSTYILFSTKAPHFLCSSLLSSSQLGHLPLPPPEQPLIYVCARGAVGRCRYEKKRSEGHLARVRPHATPDLTPESRTLACLPG